MSEWWSYTLADLLMFSPRTYYRLFELYNAAIWPGQILAVLAGIVILVCALRPGAASARLAVGLLAACWLWVAWELLLKRYATIHLAGNYFAAGFAIEALLLFWSGTVRGRLAFKRERGMIERAGLGMAGFALFAWPLLAPLSGRPWLQMEIFGLMPDPTAIATLGLLLLTAGNAWLLWPLPLLWCVISGATLFTMDAPDAWVAPTAVLMALLLAGMRTRSS